MRRCVGVEEIQAETFGQMLILEYSSSREKISIQNRPGILPFLRVDQLNR
jgi:hypothetical protein